MYKLMIGVFLFFASVSSPASERLIVCFDDLKSKNLETKSKFINILNINNDFKIKSTSVEPLLPDLFTKDGKRPEQNLREKSLIRSNKKNIPNKLISNTNAARTYVLSFENSQDCDIAYQKIINKQGVISCCKDISVSINLPNDTYLDPNQDGIWNSGSFNNSFPDLWGIKAIQADLVWNQGFKGQGVVVAVIDTGIDYNHPDIQGSIWVNTGEIPGNNIDDDANGFVDDYYGYNFYSGDSDPLDLQGHGSHVAGIIAAPINGLGVVGVAPEAKVMAVQFLGQDGSGNLVSGIRGMYYAINNGADILSNSWGPDLAIPEIPEINDVIQYAEENGVVVVFAAGNAGSDNSLYFPANVPQIISVGAINPNLVAPSFSNYGLGVEVFAPGASVLSLRANGTDLYHDGSHIVGEQYLWANGTSMACPHVSGVIALMKSAFFNDPSQIREAITQSATDIGAQGIDDIYSNGMVNAYSSVFYSYFADIVFFRSVYNLNTTSIPFIIRDGNSTDSSINVAASNGRETINIVALRNQQSFFVGSVNVSSFISSNNTLFIRHNDQISLSYFDALNETGQPELISRSVRIDGVGPVISNVTINSFDNGVMIQCSTDEISDMSISVNGISGIPSVSMTSHKLYATVDVIGQNYQFSLLATDLAGNQSNYVGNFFSRTPIYWVSKNGNGNFTSLEDAIRQVPVFSEIRVIGEEYSYPNEISDPIIDWNDKMLKIKGGYLAINGDRDVILNKTVINGFVTNPEYGVSNKIAFYIHNLDLNPLFTSELSGFEIRNCGGSIYVGFTAFGSIIVNDSSKVLFNDIKICDTNMWGACSVYGSDTEFSRCQFSDNSGYAGSAISVSLSKIKILDSLFLRNSATGWATLGSYKSNIVVERSRFTENITTNPTEPRASVAIHILENSAVYRDCIFDHNIGNSAFDINGAFSNIKLDNCTLYNNIKTNDSYIQAGSVMFTANNCEFTSCNEAKIYNSILWNSSFIKEINDDGVLLSDIQNVLDIRNCIIHNNTVQGVSIINSDPLFVNPEYNVFELDINSPAIDAGFVDIYREFDFDKTPRIIGSTIDIGAQEYNSRINGDLNCDNLFNNFDIDAFVLCLTDLDSYRYLFGCELNGDMNNDNLVDFFDIDPFVENILR